MHKNNGCNPFGGCIATIVGGFCLTLLLMGAVESCKSISPAAAKSVVEGLAKLFMWGTLFVMGYAFLNKD